MSTNGNSRSNSRYTVVLDPSTSNSNRVGSRNKIRKSIDVCTRERTHKTKCNASSAYLSFQSVSPSSWSVRTKQLPFFSVVFKNIRSAGTLSLAST